MKKWTLTLIVLTGIAAFAAYAFWNQEPVRWSALPTSIAVAAKAYQKETGKYPLSVSDLDAFDGERQADQPSFAEICERNGADVYFGTDGQRRHVIIVFDEGRHAEVRDISSDTF
jgi:hypothetical protein